MTLEFSEKLPDPQKNGNPKHAKGISLEYEPRIRKLQSGLWFVSFKTARSFKPQQLGYYQNFYDEPNAYDIEVVYNNFLELIKRSQ